MRDYFERLEDQLSPLAAKSKLSKGRQFPEPPCPHRTCFQRDRDRIIHSKAFRRLKHKTQVFVAGESDHYRSRLTHSLEVAQVSRHISRLLMLNEDLGESIALAHDLGHTPFGHSGEKILNLLMKESGGFEHNLQSRRVVDVIEKKYPGFRGLNLTLEVRDGLLKHSTPWDHPDSSDELVVTLEAQVANVADEIAYNNHDIDDGTTSGLLDVDDIEKEVTLWAEAKKVILSRYSQLSPLEFKTLINSYLISSQVKNVIRTSRSLIDDSGIESLDDLQKTSKKLVSFDKEMSEKNMELRKYLFKNFYSHSSVHRMNKKGQLIIEQLFTAFINDRGLLPEKVRDLICSDNSKERVVADYIAGMTDNYAHKEYFELFPGHSQVPS